MPTVNQHAPGSFSWFELGTTDQDAAKNFYTRLFNWTSEDHPMGPGGVYTMFRLNGRDAAAGYTLNPQQRSQGVPPHWMIYIAVENADQTAGRAAELGATLMAPPFDVFDIGRMAVIADPTGAVFSIWQAKKHSGVGVIGEDGAFSWADLNTRDPESAKRFYGQLFGWNITAGKDDPTGYLHIQNGEHYIGGIPSPKQIGNVPPHWLVYFHVSDCGKSLDRAADMDAQVLLPTTRLEHVGRFAVVKDPQGAAFALFEPEKK